MKKLAKPQSIHSAAVLAAILVFASIPCFSQATYFWAADYNSGTVYKHDATGALILKWEQISSDIQRGSPLTAPIS
jgi:hypothetical protein